MLFKKPGSAIGRLSDAVSPAGGGAGGSVYLAVRNSEDTAGCDYPLGIETGDLILSLAGGTSSITTPTGFTAIGMAQDVNLTAFARASYKIATGSETGSLSASGASFHSLLVFRNHDGIGGFGGGSDLASVGSIDLPAVGSYQARPSLFAYGASRDIGMITGDDPSSVLVDMRGAPVVPHQYAVDEVNAAFTPIPVDYDPGATASGDFRISLASSASTAVIAVQVLSR